MGWHGFQDIYGRFVSAPDAKIHCKVRSSHPHCFQITAREYVGMMSSVQIQPDGIVHGMSQSLLGSKIAFCGLDRGMPKQQLDLFEVSPSFPAKLRTGPPQIMRRQLPKVSSLGIAHHQPPDCFLIPDLRAGKVTGLADRPEEPGVCDAGGFEPGIDAGLDAGRHRDRPYPASLPFHVRENPSPFSLLQVFDVDAEQLCPAQTTPEQQGQDGAVAQSRESLRVGRVEQIVGLFLHQPVPYPIATLLDPGHTFDCRGCCRVEHPVIGHLTGELAKGRQPEVHGRRG
jgi:hypothetical protein